MKKSYELTGIMLIAFGLLNYFVFKFKVFDAILVMIGIMWIWKFHQGLKRFREKKNVYKDIIDNPECMPKGRFE